MSDAISAVASVSGAIISGRLTESETRWARRRASSERLVSSLMPLRRLLVGRHSNPDVAEWKSVFTAAVHAAQIEQYTVPASWRRLEQSLREAIACAVGLGVADRMCVHECEDDFRPDGTWTLFAVDYLDYVMQRIARWGDESNTRRARKSELADFGAWLARSGRYAPGVGVWPGDGDGDGRTLLR